MANANEAVWVQFLLLSFCCVLSKDAFVFFSVSVCDLYKQLKMLKNVVFTSSSKFYKYHYIKTKNMSKKL